MPKQRWRLTIEYDGRPFVGWQRQKNGRGVQQALEEAVTRFSGEEVTVFGAGRTDAGVHALGQVAHFELAKTLAGDRIREALNYYLRPEPIAVLDVTPATTDFHARFSARRRRYRYRIVNRRAPLTLERGLAWQVARTLDRDAMQEGAQMLVGKHDFTTFRSIHCQAGSPVKTLDRLDVTRQCDELIIYAEARSFLHHQVRSMVGSLKLVGEGKWRPADMKRALDACDRAALGLNAPPDGLYLVAVDYEGEA